jgi:hypothetical protein
METAPPAAPPRAGAPPDGRSRARRSWALAEPFHALTYFADEARTAFAAAGLRTFWAGYFAAARLRWAPSARRW